MSTLAAKLGLVVLSGAAALAITAIGQGLWGLMVVANLKLTPALPWAAVLMPMVLAALVAFLAGHGWPRWGAAARRGLLPLGPVSARAWAWSLIAGAAGVFAAAALWTVMASIVRVPPNALPDMRGVPALTLGAFLVVSVIAAPLTEEVAFRGYAMGLLRRRFSPAAALVITSALFAAAHLTQGLYAPKLLVYFLAGLVFGLVALRTGSLLPAMVVHALADLVFFTLVWPNDARRRLIGEGGSADSVLAGLVVMAVCLPLCAYAFVRLGRATRTPILVPGAAPAVLASA